MRPTAKDLAEAAGVSLATVDRVLNDRPNVSPKAARLVNDAIERIGFVRNPAAVSLARNKVYRFLFLLPDSGDLYLRELLRHVEELTSALKGDLTEISYRQIETDDAHGLAKLLSSLDKETVDGVAVMAPESPQSATPWPGSWSATSRSCNSCPARKSCRGRLCRHRQFRGWRDRRQADGGCSRVHSRVR